MSEGLFELAEVHVRHGDHVEVTMPWGETWRCGVVAIKHRDGWPVAELHRLMGPYGPEDVFTVDVARCRLVRDQPALEGL
jgi:hypothetical protein